MKQLSIEEKAKAYDKAIETFDVILNLDNVKESGTIFVDDIRKIFPELAESEDEKIRKAVINVFATHKDYEIFFGASVKDILAWLEKQGQQKQEWNEDDEDYYDAIIAKLEVTQDDASLTDNQMDFLKSLKDRVQPQSQWKPSDEQMKALWEVYKGGEEQVALASLWSDLKKLKSE